MKRVSDVVAKLAAGAALSVACASVSAAILFSEDFTGETISSGNITLADGVGSNDNLDRWLGLSTWTIQAGGFCVAPCTGAFAQQGPTTNNLTQYIFRGTSLSGFSAGTLLTVNFDYILSANNGRVILGGMNYGVHTLDPFPAIFDNVPGDGSTALDGVVFTTANLATSSTWRSQTVTFALTQPFDVLVVAFEMGGTSGNRGIDNVVVSAAVPAPGTLGLIGAAVLAGALVRRRRA